ncbi:hypothetical protein BAOM_3640 [Peribacillus asahii]|uniref:Uncharacterized protein n=1 Tax=Peribacillus asahii TaxID=228899 RepID=A0A3T0KV26_9BACI|nr:hypothetical protein BAOM_3640 [Peribacillus asahii]
MQGATKALLLFLSKLIESMKINCYDRGETNMEGVWRWEWILIF